MQNRRDVPWSFKRIAELITQLTSNEDYIRLAIKDIEVADVWSTVGKNIEYWENVPKIELVDDLVAGNLYVARVQLEDKKNPDYSNSWFFVYIEKIQEQPKKAVLKNIKERQLGIGPSGKLEETYRKDLMIRIHYCFTTFVVILNAVSH